MLVAPFLCTRIIQRFGVSNPSPRYVSECTNAFTTGLYSSGPHEFGSGEYGSLEAMAAAIVLDNEATSAAVTIDPGHGSLREPILKVLALMRSMEYQVRETNNFAIKASVLYFDVISNYLLFSFFPDQDS